MAWARARNGSGWRDFGSRTGPARRIIRASAGSRPATSAVAAARLTLAPMVAQYTEGSEVGGLWTSASFQAGHGGTTAIAAGTPWNAVRRPTPGGGADARHSAGVRPCA